MNKKNMFFMTMMMALATSSMLPMSDSEERAIRKDLYLNYENDQINTFTLAEDGLTLSEVIDRDITILSQHKYSLQRRMTFCKGAVKSDLFVGGFWGGSSILSGLICSSSFGKIKDLIQNDYASGKTGVWFVDKVAYNLLSPMDYEEFVKKNLSAIAKCDPKINAFIDTTCITAAVTVICGLLFLNKLCNVCGYARTLYRYIQKTQKHVERDQAIIDRLAAIKEII